MNVLWGTCCHAVSDLEVPLATSCLLDLMDITAHEASSGHLLEGVGEVMGPLVVVVRAVHLEICPPSHLDGFGVFPKGFLAALLKEPHQVPPLFPPSAGPFFRSDI